MVVVRSLLPPTSPVPSSSSIFGAVFKPVGRRQNPLAILARANTVWGVGNLLKGGGIFGVTGRAAMVWAKVPYAGTW